MISPKLLFNFVLIATVIAIVGIYIWIGNLLYLGFETDPKTSNEKIIVTRVSPEILLQGLKVGDQIVAVNSGSKSITLNPTHFSTTPVQRKQFYSNKGEYFHAQHELHEVLSQPVVTFTLVDSSTVDIRFQGFRTFNEFGNTVWVRLSLGVLSALIGIMVWVWRPRKKETIYYALSGVGLALAIFSSAIYSIPMLVFSYDVLLVLDVFTLAGNYMYLTFGVCSLLYFPQILPYASVAAKRIFMGIGLCIVYALFNTWDLDKSWSQQRLYVSDLEIYVPILIAFIFVLFFCYQQWHFSRGKPVERARSSWVILSWLIGPSAYMLFYYIPTVVGSEPQLTRTWAWAVICSSYLMILIGISRFKLFDLEHRIAAMWQWLAVFMVFLLFDMAFASVTNLAPQISTFLVLVLTLWVYIPLRQWVYSKVNKRGQHHTSKQFVDAASALLLSKREDPRTAWADILTKVFAPVSIAADSAVTRSAVKNRGQGLMVAANKFSPAMYLDCAENGERLFTEHDAEFVATLSMLFEQLYGFHLSFVAGQNKERERIRRDLHDLIGHKLLSLIYATDDKKVKGIAQETLDQIRGLLTALRFEPVPLQSTIMEVRKVAAEACANFDLELIWENQVSEVSVLIGSYQYLNIVNIARELLNNIVSHAQAERVTVVAVVNLPLLNLTFIDDGIGFIRNNIDTGNGLYNIDVRARELGATIDWYSGKGSRVEISVPLKILGEH